MKHINLTAPLENGLAKYMVTQESNSFGDQILTLKKYVVKKKIYRGEIVTSSQYIVIAKTSNIEGSWMQLKDMRNWLKQIIIRGES